MRTDAAPASATATARRILSITIVTDTFTYRHSLWPNSFVADRCVKQQVARVQNDRARVDSSSACSALPLHSGPIAWVWDPRPFCCISLGPHLGSFRTRRVVAVRPKACPAPSMSAAPPHFPRPLSVPRTWAPGPVNPQPEHRSTGNHLIFAAWGTLHSGHHGQTAWQDPQKYHFAHLLSFYAPPRPTGTRTIGLLQLL